MNKEVGYILQGFLLLLVAIAAAGVGQFLFSMEHHDTSETAFVSSSSNEVKQIDLNSRGAVLFHKNCYACHAVFATDNLLRGVTERVVDRKLLIDWIRDSKAVLQSGNPYFNHLYEQCGKAMQPPFPDLTDEDIEAIIDFIDETSPAIHPQ